MPAGKGPEAVVEKRFVRLLADSVVYEHPFGTEAARVIADAVCGDGGKVGLAACEEVRARFAEEVFHALGDEEGEGYAETEAHPAG